MKKPIAAYAAALIAIWSSLLAQQPVPEMKRILQGFELRETGNDFSTEKHYKWLKTESGKRDAQWLADNFDHLPDKSHLCMELARTGAVEVAPFVKKALADSVKDPDMLSGIYFACFVWRPEKAFGTAIAPAVVPWLGSKSERAREHAIQVLPILDAEVAKNALLTDQFLSDKSSSVVETLRAFNEVALTIPVDRIEKLIASWGGLNLSEETEYRIRMGYIQAIVALAKHQPARAVQLAEELMKKLPGDAREISEIFLSASGLGSSDLLNQSISTHTDTPEEFNKLPPEAQYYFAIREFESEFTANGIEQVMESDTGNLFAIALEGLERIGASKYLDVLRSISAFFGPNGPSNDQQARIRQMDAMRPSLHEQFEKVRISSQSDPELAIALLNKFAAKHAEVLRPLLHDFYR